jgi:lysozyme family protein
MNYKALINILAIVCSSCSQADKKTRSEKVSEIEGRTFYIETVDFGSDLNRCFGYTIFNKWSSHDFLLKDSKQVYTGKEPKEKHLFSDIKNFNESLADQDIEKIVVRLKGDWSIKNTKYSIERYKYDGNGNWRIIVNLGDFMTGDRVNDFISPNQLDVDEICEQIVATTVKASYK